MTSSIEQVVLKIVDHYALTPTASLNMSWDAFVALMSTGEKPVYDSLRTIREKWRVLHALHYVQPINQYSVRVNVPLIFSEVVKGARP